MGDPLYDGARYDPILDHWTPLPPLPSGILGDVAVWTGAELLIWGGGGGGLLPPPPSEPGTGARWDPTTDAWTAMSVVDAPRERSGAVGLWTGTHLFVWGGGTMYQGVGGGGLYNPEADQWTRLPGRNAPSWRFFTPAAWTGREVVIWSGVVPIGSGSVRPLDDGAAYDPATNTWRALPPGPLQPRQDHTVVWTGPALLWGHQTEHRVANP